LESYRFDITFQLCHIFGWIRSQTRSPPAKSLLMIGLRGVGKTVPLDRMREIAERSHPSKVAEM
jgi:hypothetical protein